LSIPNFPPADSQLADAQDAARSLGLQIRILRAGNDREIEIAFETINSQHIVALAVAAGPFFDTRRAKLVALGVKPCRAHSVSVP
jgi:putative tryptophan/tyrosine transport system substrate-binding protein